jgi:hypothetical protein
LPSKRVRERCAVCLGWQRPSPAAGEGPERVEPQNFAAMKYNRFAVTR